MVFHTNTVIHRTLNSFFKFKGGDSVEPEVENYIQPVLNIDPFTEETYSIKASTSAAQHTVGAIPADKDAIVTNVMLSIINSTTSDVSEYVVRGTSNGKTIVLARIPGMNIALRDSTSISIRNPVKLDRGTNITLDMQFTTGTTAAAVVVYCYFTD